MIKHTSDDWVWYDHLTDMVRTKDGTAVDAILTDTAYRLIDFLYIAIIRDKQRQSKREKQQ